MLSTLDLYLNLNKIKVKLLNKRNYLFQYLPVQRVSPSGMVNMDSVLFSQKLKTITGDIKSVLTPLSEEKKEIVSLADSSFNSLRILGVDVPSDKINWSCDYRSGFQWPTAFFLKQRLMSDGTGADIKFPWELSRAHHLLWLAEAYLVTKEQRYSDAVRDNIKDWIKNNPLLFSVNWCCPMDAAIRAVNWVYALSMISESNSFKGMDSEDLKKIYKSLYQHGWYIFHNLERRYPYRHNHYFSDIVGLIFLGRLFDTTPHGRKWFRFAEKEFYRELRIQTLPSGVNYEFSISYHRLMTELSAYTIHFLYRVGQSVPEDIIKKTETMLEYVSAYTKSNGLAPIVGDNDDGRFLPFVRRDFRNHRYLIDSHELENRIVYIDSPIIKLPEYKTQGDYFYSDAGHCVIKNRDVYLSVVNRNSGCFVKDVGDRYVGGHTHNDKLSFELSVGGIDVFVDPGTYLYTSDIAAHNEFRSTKKHNTAVVDGEEQNILSSLSAFSYLPNTKVDYLILDKDSVYGSYHTMKGGMTHSREFRMREGNVDVLDYLRKVGTGHNFTISFHLAPGLKATLYSDYLIIRAKEYDVIMSFDTKAKDLDIRIEPDKYSPSYGVLEDCECIRVVGSFDENVNIATKMKINRHN